MAKPQQVVLKTQTITSTLSKAWTVNHVFDAATEQNYRQWIDPAAPTVVVRTDVVGPLAINHDPTGPVRSKAPDVP